MNFEKSLLNGAFCSVTGRRSNVTYFGKLDPGDLGLLYSSTCWVLLLVLKEGEILQCHPCDRKSWHFQLLVIFVHFIFTNLITHSAQRHSMSCVPSLSVSCVPVYFLIHGPVLNDFCFYFP